jgi:hypothetical protein
VPRPRFPSSLPRADLCFAVLVSRSMAGWLRRLKLPNRAGSTTGKCLSESLAEDQVTLES